jgi:hypothetical protein
MLMGEGIKICGRKSEKMLKIRDIKLWMEFVAHYD